MFCYVLSVSVCNAQCSHSLFSSMHIIHFNSSYSFPFPSLPPSSIHLLTLPFFFFVLFVVHNVYILCVEFWKFFFTNSSAAMDICMSWISSKCPPVMGPFDFEESKRHPCHIWWICWVRTHSTIFRSFSFGWHEEGTFTVFLIILPKRYSWKIFRTVSESGRKEGISALKASENIRSEINDNVSFTVYIYF